MKCRLGVYTLRVYNLGLPIWYLEILKLRLGVNLDDIEIGSLYSGRVYNLGLPILDLAVLGLHQDEIRLWEYTTSGYRI